MGKYTQQLRNRLQGLSTPIQLRPSVRVVTNRPNLSQLEKEEPTKPVRPSADSTNLMNGEYFPQSEFPADKGFWDGACNRGQCLRPGAKWYNFGSNAYYCQPCAHMLSHDAFNYQDSQRTWGPGKLLCEFQPTSEPLPNRTWLK